MNDIAGMPFTVGSALECQGKCEGTAGCAYFSFISRSGHCWLSNSSSNAVRAPVEGSVTGPARCQAKDLACSAMPDARFPAITPGKSRATWPGNHQPTNLQCWPRLASGFPRRCPYHVATVLEDTIHGWPGRCENMQKIDDLKHGETCKQRCVQSALCGVWSVENTTSKVKGKETCWHALHGVNCNDGKGPRPVRAQHLMHGSYRRLARLKGLRIPNLTRAFKISHDAEEGRRRCRVACLSYLFCQYWQYSVKEGCWLEDPAAKEVSYPMVLPVNGKGLSDESWDGEFIQHVCRPDSVAPLPTTDFGPKAVRRRSDAPHHTHHPDNMKERDAVGGGGGRSGSSLIMRFLIGLTLLLCSILVCGVAYKMIMDHCRHSASMSKRSKREAKQERRTLQTAVSHSESSRDGLSHQRQQQLQQLQQLQQPQLVFEQQQSQQLQPLFAVTPGPSKNALPQELYSAALPQPFSTSQTFDAPEPRQLSPLMQFQPHASMQPQVA
eukprot:CAMPEP_0172904520 /NCGR_PEP_ID=MMETSP1075-20121228/172813_1 /TAXON_ID=2916 /ORGANISM="Ceratium fusus, Strain PA161109" /LENGTH=495 /DNA_ID=CAMNT_0013761583 /DNA_START=65 /DNA_END=1548 /DNA_ORIENTATION=+